MDIPWVLLRWGRGPGRCSGGVGGSRHLLIILNSVGLNKFVQIRGKIKYYHNSNMCSK